MSDRPDVLENLTRQIEQLEWEKQALIAEYEQQIQETSSKLRQLENRYTSLVTNATVGIFRTDAEGNCVFVNERYCQITGLTPTTAMGMGWRERLHPDDREILANHWYECATDHRPFRAEYRFQHPDGVVVWVLGESIEEKSPTGELLGYIGTVTDINDRVRAELALRQSEAKNRQLNADLEKRIQQNSQALEESEKRFCSIFQENPLGTALLSSEYHFRRANFALTELLGYSELELQSLNLGDIIHPLDFNIYREQKQQHDGQDRVGTQIELRCLTRQGKVIWVQLILQCLDNFHEQDIVKLALFYDITENQQTELEREKLLNILEASLNEVHIFSAQDFRFQYINQRALKNLGYSAESMRKMTPIDIQPELNSTLLRQFLLPLITQKREKTIFQTLQRRADGTSYPVEVHWQSIKQGGEPVFLAVILDISERQIAEEERQKLVSLVEYSIDFIVIVKPTGKIDYLNQAGRKLIGLLENPENYQIVNFFSEEYATIFNEKVWPSLQQGKTWQGEGSLIHWQNQQAIPILQSWVPITEPYTGKIQAFAGIFRDLSEQKDNEIQLKNSLVQKELLLKEVHHRVKNNLQVISSLFSLQSQYIKSAEVLEFLADAQNRVLSMALIHEQLYQSADLSKIAFPDYLRTLINHLISSQSLDKKLIDIDWQVATINLDLDRAIPCGLLLNELVSNVLKHAFKKARSQDKKITIHFSVSTAKNYYLSVADNGDGFPDGLNLDQIPTLGLRLVKALTRQLRGQLKIEQNNGVVVSIVFPLS
jgi:PAS domain S-box-containing protein